MSISRVVYTDPGDAQQWNRERRYREIQSHPVDTTLFTNYGIEHWYVHEASGWGDMPKPDTPLQTLYWQETRPNYGWIFGPAGPSDTTPNYPAYHAAYAKAYGRFMDAVNKGGTQSELLTGLAERHQTFGMVMDRMKQFYKGASHLKRGEFRAFLNTFGIKPKRKHKDTVWSRPRDFSALWLEYWFGWAPTVADLMNAFEIYQRESSSGKPFIAKGSSRSLIGSPDDPFSVYSNSGYWKGQQDYGSVQVRIAGKVIVDSDVALKLNQLGLVNVPLTAWNLIPFSWFAGWFGNIAQVLGQLSDTVGLRLSDLSISVKTIHTHNYTMGHSGYGVSGGVTRNWTRESYTRKKVTVLPRVHLVWKMPSHLSPTRGATLASLIVQLFAPSKVR